MSEFGFNVMHLGPAFPPKPFSAVPLKPGISNSLFGLCEALYECYRGQGMMVEIFVPGMHVGLKMILAVARVRIHKRPSTGPKVNA